MPQLNPAWFASQLFWLLISLTLLYVVLARYALPPIMAVLEQRRATREGDLAAAQALKSEAEAAQADYERALTEARARAQVVFADSESKSKAAAEKSLAELNRTLHARIAEAEARIGKGKETLLRTLEPAVARLAQQAAEKLLPR